MIQSTKCFIVFLSLGAIHTLAGDTTDEPVTHLFELPAKHERHFRMLLDVDRSLQINDLASAEKLGRQYISLIPTDPFGHIQLARTLTRQGKKKEALNCLMLASKFGFRDAAQIRAHVDFRPLRGLDGFEETLSGFGGNAEWLRGVTPSLVKGTVAMVSRENTAYDPLRMLLLSMFTFDEENEGGSGRALSARSIATGPGKAAELLRLWYAEGTAAGNVGDLYDNHDHDHSRLDDALFPQISRVDYCDAAKSAGLNHGLQTRWLFNRPTVGNSSTALTDKIRWRSQTRAAYSSAASAKALYRQYRANHLYIYPEHRDHDPGLNGLGGGYGDLFPANTPYVITSQGSSGSDQPFLRAVASTLAAFRPGVKRKLIEQQALMPTIQMIFRSSAKSITKGEDYLTAKAHPSAFDAKFLDVEKMVRAAHEMSLDALPPLIDVRIVHEDKARSGIDHGDALDERLFDTPCSIARIARSTQMKRRMIVTAGGSRDLNDLPLTWHWVVLRGDKRKIEITPLNDSGSKVDIVVSYHKPQLVPGMRNMVTNRVEIGAFVHNGQHFSAPAFITVCYPTNEKRQYNGTGLIESIEYLDYRKHGIYADPLLFPVKLWQDHYSYDEGNRLMGFTRLIEGKQQDFTADGALIVKKDGLGRATRAQVLRYVIEKDKDGYPLVIPKSTDRTIAYQYASNEDRIGTRVAP